MNDESKLIWEQYLLLQEVNLTNKSALIDKLLNVVKQKTTDPNILNWFKNFYVKNYINTDDNRSSLKKYDYQKSDPEWMQSKELYQFTDFDNQEIDEIHHIIDYFKSLDELELKKINRQPYDIIKSKIKKWEESFSKKESDFNLSENEDFKVLKKYSTNFRWVQLLTKKSYEYEGSSMGHCVGGYDPEDESNTIISLYGPNNKPRITIELNKQKKEVVQVKGNSNTKPKKEYQKYLLDIIKYYISKGYFISESNNVDGIVNWEEKTYIKNSEEWNNIFENEIKPNQNKLVKHILSKLQ